MFSQISFRITSTTCLEEIKEVPPTCRNCQLQKIKCSRTNPCTRCDRLMLECFVETHAPRPLELASTIASLKKSIESIGMRLERFEGDTNLSHSMGCDLIPANEGVLPKSIVKMRKVKISKMISSMNKTAKEMERRLEVLEEHENSGDIDNNDSDLGNNGFHIPNKVKLEAQQTTELNILDQEMAVSKIAKIKQQLRYKDNDPGVELSWRLILTQSGLMFDSKITTFKELDVVIHQFHHRYLRHLIPPAKSGTSNHSASKFYSDDYSGEEPVSKNLFSVPQLHVPSYNQAAHHAPSTSFPIISFITQNLTDTLIHTFMTYHCCSFTRIHIIDPTFFLSRYDDFTISNDFPMKDPFEALVLSMCSFTARHGMKAHDHLPHNIDIAYAYDRGARLLIEEYFDQPSLDVVQAILYIVHFSPETYLPFEQLTSDSSLLWLAVRMLLEIRIYRDDVTTKHFLKRELHEFKLVQIAIGTQIPWCDTLYANRLSDGLHLLFDLVDIVGLKSYEYSKKEEGYDNDSSDTSQFNELCTLELQIARLTLDAIDNLNSSDASNFRIRTFEIQSRISAWHHSLPKSWSFSSLDHRPQINDSPLSSQIHISYSCILALWSMVHTAKLFLFLCSVSFSPVIEPGDLDTYLCLAIEVIEHAEHAYTTGRSCLLRLYNLDCAQTIFNIFISFNDARADLARQYSNRLLAIKFLDGTDV